MATLRKALHPLTRKLAVRLARKRRHGRKGPLDFRNTVRHSLSYGGVPAEPKFKYPRPAKPDDRGRRHLGFGRRVCPLHIAARVRHLAPVLQVRSFVFIDGIDEVTRFFEGIEDIADAIHRVNTEADVVWVDGHSDYGHAFEVFWQRRGQDVSSKTTVIILGDARNNYHSSQSWVIKEIRKKARHVWWLNPEPVRTGTRATPSSASTDLLRRRVRVPQPAPAGEVRRLPRLAGGRRRLSSGRRCPGPRSSSGPAGRCRC